MYSKKYLKQQVKAAFNSDNVSGDLVNLVADVLSEYAYLHQLIDINILMENSFLRSTKLNSRIQQAADRFYSVPRGYNRIVKISDLMVYKQGETIYPFQLVTQNAGGKYKLYAEQPWNEQQGNLTATGYLALDCQTVELQGSGKLYMDVEQDNNGVKIPCENISEDIVVYQTWTDQSLATAFDFTTDNAGNITYYRQVELVSSLADLFNTNEIIPVEEEQPPRERFCAITMPNYGVRLYSKTAIKQTQNYIVSYLTCPDPKVEEKEPASAIKNISNCKITNNTEFEIIRKTSYRLEDLDAIYLYASNNLRMSGILKSINAIEELIPEVFPEFQSYKMLVGPIGNTYSGSSTVNDDNIILHDVVNVSNNYGSTIDTVEEINSSIIEYVPNGAVYIYYVWENDLNPESGGTHYPSQQQIDNWNAKAKAYYIPDNTQFFFKNINVKVGSNVFPAHVKKLDNYKINIYYSNNIDYQRVREIVESFQYQIGEDFNPYKIISNLVTDSILYGKIKYVEILHNNSDGDSVENWQPAQVIKMPIDQRWWFSTDYSELVEFKQV